MENLKTELKAVLSSLVDFDGLCYDDGPRENTLKQGAEQLYQECIKWRFDRGQATARQLPKLFTEGLQGLPSYISIPFYNYDIEKLMYSIGYEGAEAVGLYWDLCGQILADEFTAE